MVCCIQMYTSVFIWALLFRCDVLGSAGGSFGANIRNSRSQGKAEGRGKINRRKGFRGWEVGSRGPEPMAPARRRWENMSAAHVVSQSVSVSCAYKHARERARRPSRLGTTSRSEALLGPISWSRNLQTTLGTLSTHDESLPAWCDLFSPAEQLGYK